jgi:hypothetical protein
VTALRAVDVGGEAGFELVDEANAAGDQSISTIVQRGEQVLRVKKDELVAGALAVTTLYDPGFLRFDYGWVEGEEAPSMVERTELDPQGVVLQQDVRYSLFTVESVAAEVAVPAGTFECVQFLRERADTGESERFWFAPGVGKVKQESPMTGDTEELTTYEIP